MRVIAQPHGLVLAAPAEGYVRSPGLHMSDIYGSFFKAYEPKKYDKKDADGKDLPFDLTKMELGLVFEQQLETALGVRLLGDRPGEFLTQHADDCDKTILGPKGTCPCGAGIAYSPDYLFYEEDELVLGELKLTWYSSRGCPQDPKFAKWIVQVMAYAYHLRVTKARLFAYFVNNDYKPPSPALLMWELVFTQRELKDNWVLLLRHARKARLL